MHPSKSFSLWCLETVSVKLHLPELRMFAKLFSLSPPKIISNIRILTKQTFVVTEGLCKIVWDPWDLSLFSISLSLLPISLSFLPLSLSRISDNQYTRTLFTLGVWTREKVGGEIFNWFPRSNVCNISLLQIYYRNPVLSDEVFSILKGPHRFFLGGAGQNYSMFLLQPRSQFARCRWKRLRQRRRARETWWVVSAQQIPPVHAGLYMHI